MADKYATLFTMTSYSQSQTKLTSVKYYEKDLLTQSLVKVFLQHNTHTNSKHHLVVQTNGIHANMVRENCMLRDKSRKLAI